MSGNYNYNLNTYNLEPGTKLYWRIVDGVGGVGTTDWTSVGGTTNDYVTVTGTTAVLTINLKEDGTSGTRNYTIEVDRSNSFNSDGGNPDSSLAIVVEDGSTVSLATQLANMWLADVPNYTNFNLTNAVFSPVRNDFISRHCYNLTSQASDGSASDGWEFRPYLSWNIVEMDNVNASYPTLFREDDGNGSTGAPNTSYNSGTDILTITRTLTVKNKNDARKAAAQDCNWVTILYNNANGDGNDYAQYVEYVTVNGVDYYTNSATSPGNTWNQFVSNGDVINSKVGYLQLEIPYNDINTISVTMKTKFDSNMTLQEILLIPGKYNVTWYKAEANTAGSSATINVPSVSKDDLVFGWAYNEDGSSNGSTGYPSISTFTSGTSSYTNTMRRSNAFNDYGETNMYVITADGTFTFRHQRSGQQSATVLLHLQFADNTAVPGSISSSHGTYP